MSDQPRGAKADSHGALGVAVVEGRTGLTPMAWLSKGLRVDYYQAPFRQAKGEQANLELIESGTFLGNEH